MSKNSKKTAEIATQTARVEAATAALVNPPVGAVDFSALRAAVRDEQAKLDALLADSRNTTMNTATDATQAWRKGNDAGEGFAPGPYFTDRVTVEEAIDDMLDATGARLMLDLSGDGIQVVECAGGRLVGVCDANGAWAVVLHEPF